MNCSATIANSLWTAANVPALIQFQNALRRPAETQWHWLRNFLARNANSAYGRAHGYADIRNYDDFARRVPLVDYDDLEPWIERIRHGEHNVLTSEVVTRLVPTSGSSGARKLIPFTAGLQRDFDRAISPWTASLCLRHPSLAFGPAYWSISPALPDEHDEPSAIAIGFENDSSYLGGAKKRLVDSIMAVPPEIRFVSDMKQFRYLTLLCLLRQRDLRLLSVWHPSFLQLLLDALPDAWENLLDDIQRGDCIYSKSLPKAVLDSLRLRPLPRRANELKMAGPEKPGSIWPSLEVISCWGGGNAEPTIANLERLFPRATIQRKGLVATEAIVTIPYFGSHPLAVRSHFFEFIDRQGCPRMAHEVQINETYDVAVTTAGGLCRYRLRDEVRVTGFVGKTPALQFLGRKGEISDQFGEKLSEAFVNGVLRELFASPPRFLLLAPDETDSGSCYTLHIQGDISPELSSQLDHLLMKNIHYAWCRKLGQLQPPQIFRIHAGGQEAFMAREVAAGKRIGEIKPSVLSVRNDWSRHFSGEYLPLPLKSDMYNGSLVGDDVRSL